ncbi:MAG TPA: PEP-CTERM sorting domain-containing protein [Acetobacteraceae bacterium]|nr:PEP-CTERM sorting domain-containing protein [Acetobacteraceae bacterium]
MSFDTSLVNNVVFAASNTAAVNGANILGGGNYSVDASLYTGAFTDYWGTEPAANVVTVTTSAYNPTLAPGIITFNYTYGDGTVVPLFGGDVVAWNAHDILVQVLDGFVPNNQAAGTYVGNLDPAFYLVLGGWGQNLSFEANGGAGPTLPLLFGNTGSFTVPEPSTYALILVALIATTIVRLPLFRRLLGGFAA